MVERTHRNGSTPHLLLVHDAFAGTSSWAAVIEELPSSSIDITAVAIALRDLHADAAYVTAVCAAIDGPVVLVGHGYGGSVITAASASALNVVGLVYVAGLIPDRSESTIGLIRTRNAGDFLTALRPTILRVGRSVVVELIIDRTAFADVVAADLPPALAAAAAAAQRPVTATALEQTPDSVGWRALPCWSLITTQDRVVDVITQQSMAARAGAITVEVAASHAVLSSQPAVVAALLRAATAPPDPAPPLEAPLRRDPPR